MHAEINVTDMKEILITLLGIFGFLYLQGQGGTAPVAPCDPCQPLGFEKVENGEFENGTLGYNTDFQFSCSCDIGTICNTNNAAQAACANPPLNNITSPSNTNYLVVSGTPDTRLIWKNENFIPVLEGEEYVFTFLIYPNLDGSFELPLFDVLINGMPVGQGISVPPDQWSEICVTYMAEAHEDLNIELFQIGQGVTSTYGIEDVSFQQVLKEALPCELMVQFSPNASQFYMDSLKNLYGVTTESICPCGDLEKWTAGDFPIYLPDGTVIIDLENLKKKTKDQSGVQSVDYNYSTKNPDAIIASGGLPIPPATIDTVENNCSVVVHRFGCG